MECLPNQISITPPGDLEALSRRKAHRGKRAGQGQGARDMQGGGAQRQRPPHAHAAAASGATRKNRRRMVQRVNNSQNKADLEEPPTSLRITNIQVAIYGVKSYPTSCF